MKIFLITIFFFILTAQVPARDLPIRFYVANHKAECQELIPQMCFLLKNSPNGEWKNHSGNIEGFNYEEGYEYEILVKKKIIENPPADAPSFVFVLVEVVRKTPTMIISKNNREFLNKKIFTVSRIRMENELHNVKVNQDCYIEFDLPENKISGKDGCNDIMGKVIINGNKISIEELASTRMLCDKVTIDKLFHKLIKKIDNYKIKGNCLKLYGRKKLLMEYVLSSN